MGLNLFEGGSAGERFSLFPLQVHGKVVILQAENRRTGNGDCQALYNSDEHKPYTFQLSKTGGNVECGFLFIPQLC